MKKSISLLALILAMALMFTSCMPLSTLGTGATQRPALPTTPAVRPTTPPGVVTTDASQQTTPPEVETTARPTTVTTSTTVATTATTEPVQTTPVTPGSVYVDIDFDYENNAITDKMGNVVCTPVGKAMVDVVEVTHNGVTISKSALVINDASKQSWVECTFTNIADYAQFNKFVEENNGFTVEAFYLNEEKSTTLQGIVCVTEGNHGKGKQGWGLAENRGAPYLVTANGQAWFFAHSNYTTNVTDFCHVVGVYDAVTQTNKTYINGELKGVVNNVAGFQAVNATSNNGFVMGTGFFIGGDPSVNTRVPCDYGVSNLQVADVKIYAGALSASEALEAYKTATAEFTDNSSNKDADTPEDIVVFLDPGHGGTDTGSTKEYDGVVYKESDINLAVALKAKAKLEALGYKVILSRTDDTYIQVSDRPAAAIAANANMFVSIHVNSAIGDIAKGFEAYYSGKNVNYDAKAFAEIFTNEFAKIKDITSSDNFNVLAYPDMTIRGTKADTKLYTNGLAVLNQKESDMPSALLELGFMTNETDFLMLISAYWQNFAAEAIANAVVAAHAAGIYKK